MPPTARAQAPDAPYLVEWWQTEHGLPENIVNAIVQTPDGYLWCGTTHGLARFDGVNFKVFNTQNTKELGSARIRQLFVDRHGALWASIFEGSIVRYKDGQFEAFTPPRRETMAQTIIRMAEDEEDALWLTVEDGSVLRLAKGVFTLASQDWSTEPHSIFQVYQDLAGKQPWVTTSNQLSRIEQGKLVPVLRGKPWQYQFLCPSRSGGWWVQTAGRVRIWRDGEWVGEAGPWVRPDHRVECCLEDARSQLWVASLGDGLFRYSTNSVMRHLLVKDGLGSPLVRALFEDMEGNLWAGTRAGGLNRLRPALFRTIGRKDGLSSDLVTAICEGQNGEMWVGTDGEGIDRLKNGTVQQFGLDKGVTGPYVRTLLVDHSGNVWAGSWPGDFFKFDADHFNLVPVAVGNGAGLASLLEDSKQRLWLGQRTLNKVVYIEKGEASSITLPNSTPSLAITCMTEDLSGAIWIGTDGNGLFRWKDGECRRYTREKDGLCSDTVRCLLCEPDGAVWIGTVDGGLCRLKNNRFVTCTTRNGLVDDVINFMVDDGLGYYWFTSFQGVFRASKKELNEFADGTRTSVQCMAFGKSDGLPALECPGGFQPAGCRTADGKLWFPTIRGLAVVDPATVPTHSATTTVIVEGVIADGEALTKQIAPPAQTPGASNRPPVLEVRPGYHRLEFRYTGLSFSSPDRVRFRHQIAGLDGDWVEAGSQRSAFYNHIPPGDYKFMVIACNQAGIWNETPASLSFRVLPYFWQTWWFTASWVVLAASTLSMVVFLTVRRRFYRKVKRLEVQLSIEKERARIAQDIHDSVGANLTEIAWLAEVAEKESERPEEVRTQARKISGTARETVQSFDEIVWAVLPQNDTLSSLVEYLGRRVDELFESSNIRYRFTAPPELPRVVVPAEVRHSFYLACKEALHNVVRHSRATEVVVLVTIENSTLKVHISDNGRGFDPANMFSSGNGLRNLRQRFEALGGHFELQSGPGVGTDVLMTLPLAKAIPAGR